MRKLLVWFCVDGLFDCRRCDHSFAAFNFRLAFFSVDLSCSFRLCHLSLLFFLIFPSCLHWFRGLMSKHWKKKNNWNIYPQKMTHICYTLDALKASICISFFLSHYLISIPFRNISFSMVIYWVFVYLFIYLYSFYILGLSKLLFCCYFSSAINLLFGGVQTKLATLFCLLFVLTIKCCIFLLVLAFFWLL